MKTIEIKRIGLVSAFKFFGGMFLVLGVILGLFSGILVNFMNIQVLSNVPVMGKLSGGLLAGIIFGIIYGLAGGIVYVIMAVMYNFFASIIGGIKVDISE